MLAGEYCPREAIENRGAILIPRGHPLYDYTSSHASVIRQYLGPFAAIGGNNDNIARTVCDIHTADWQEPPQPGQDISDMVAQAQALVNDAYNRVGAAGDDLDPNVSQLVYSAISAVETVLYSGSINASTLSNAMNNLREVMVLLP